MNPLANLPPPPQGQTGITLDQFSHLAPPPSGQKGLTLAQVQAQQPTTGSAGQAIVPGSTLGGNLKALGGNILGLIRGVGSATGANAIGEGVGTAAANI